MDTTNPMQIQGKSIILKAIVWGFITFTKNKFPGTVSILPKNQSGILAYARGWKVNRPVLDVRAC